MLKRENSPIPQFCHLSGFECFMINKRRWSKLKDINCYFSGSSCSGSYPVLHQSNNANCVLTKFNFVNNTDSNGYFYLHYGNHKRVKESVIVFKSAKSLKWLISASYTSATLSIEGSFVIASGAIDGGGKVTLTSGTITTTASQPTHTPFHSHPHHSQCSYFVSLASKHFSSQFQLHLQLQLAPKAILPALILILSTLLTPN